MSPPALPGFRRYFVTVGRRQFHYHRGGQGPCLLMLHRPPRAARDLAPVMTRLATAHTVIAPDLAGHGRSSALGTDAPDADDYVVDMLALLDALSIGSTAVVTDGVSALVGLGLVAQAPGRVVALACHDAPASSLPPAGVGEAFPAFEPRWDGAHLAWLWAFLREEQAFDAGRPKRLANRRLVGMPTPDILQSRAVQFLSGGQHGRGYERALRALHAPDPLRWLERARATGVPVSYGATVSGRDPDPGEADAAGWSGLADWLARQPRAGAPPSAPAVRAIPGELTSDYAPVPGGQLHFHFNDDASTTPLLIQHDAASSVGTVEPITRSLVGRRSVMAFDLPGSGDSDDALPPDPLEVTDYAGALERALAALRLGAVDFYGMWGGGFVGLELARVQPGRIRRLVVSNLFFHEGEELRRVQANYTPDVSPLWHGGHLLQAWHQMRDQGLFYPWFERTAAGALRREPYLDTAMVHERVCSLLKAGNRYRSAYQAHFVYPTLERLRSSPVPTLAATSEWDPNRPHTEAAAAQAPEAEFRLLDADFRRWGLSFLDFLERR